MINKSLSELVTVSWKNSLRGEAQSRSLRIVLPEHISARPEDVQLLIEGLISAEKKLEATTDFDAVVAAAMAAFNISGT